MKILIIWSPDYEVFVEHCDLGHVVHANMRSKWTKTVKQNLLKDWNAFRAIHRRNLLAVHYPEQGVKHEKFLKMFGFVPLTETWDIDGDRCLMLIAPALDQSKGQING